MRAFIAALLAASAYAAGGSIGSYDYINGGDDWHIKYRGDSNVCGTGKEQSPIDLPLGNDASHAEISLAVSIDRMGVNPFTTINVNKKEERRLADDKSVGDDVVYMPTNWHTNLEGAVSPPPNMNDVKNRLVRRYHDSLKMYAPLQFHLHTPSEHTVGGKWYDAEMHVVHQSSDGSLAVLGIFFDTVSGGDEDNKVIQDLIDKRSPDVDSLYEDVANSEYWMYDGSLTTPPCSEGVAWNVMTEVQPISKKQLDELSKFTKGTLDEDIQKYTTQEILDMVWSNNANPKVPVEDCEKRHKEPKEEGEDDDENDNAEELEDEDAEELVDEDGKCLSQAAGGNNRSIQPLNDRKIYKRKAARLSKEGASTLMASAAAIAALSLLAF